MSVLSNNYQDVAIWNLDPWSGHRGPFLVTQTGMAPGTETLRESLFVLRRDGYWVDIAAYFASGKPELLDEAVFQTTPEIMTLLHRLGPRACVAELPVPEEGLKAWLERTTPGQALEAAHQWVREYHERRARETPPPARG